MKFAQLGVDHLQFHLFDTVGTHICNGNQEVIKGNGGVFFRDTFIMVDDIAGQGIVFFRFGDGEKIFPELRPPKDEL